VSRRHPTLALAGASFFFGCMALLARVGAARGYTSPELVFARMGVGALSCCALFATGRARFDLAGRPWGLLLRGLLGTVAVLLYFFAITQVPAGEATLLNYTYPLFTLVFAVLFLGERPGPRLVGGLVVTLAGLALTVEATSGRLLSLGVVAGLASAVVSGAAIATLRSLRQTAGSTVIFFVFCLVALVMSGPLAAAHARLPPMQDLALLLGIGLASTAAQLLLTDALGHVPAAEAAALGPLTPVTAYLLAAVFLGEPLTLRIAAGILVAITGVVLGAWQPSPGAA
jgi:drug/metabolite transporter (DMT)-like permease